MRHVESISGMGAGRIKENDGGGEFNCDIRTLKNIIMYPQHNNKMIFKSPEC
jgi:hypothetical protein